MIERFGTIGIALLASVWALAGCSGPATPPPGSTALGTETVRETSTQPTSEELDTPAEPAADEGEAPPTGTMPNEADLAEQGNFTTPYPERGDLFQPPPVEHVSRPSAGDEENSSSDIRLLGFIGSDPHRAILSYNGQAQRVSQGDEIGGVEIVDIQEDTVSLRRGRMQWTLSLLDD